jgi:hypothetical protein
MKNVLSVAAASIATIICLAGCYGNVSPEMKGLSLTHDEVKLDRKVAMNQNKRMISDDLAHTFYLDHPSRLSPYPVTYTSGLSR